MGGLDWDAFMAETIRLQELPLTGLRTVVELRQTLERLEGCFAAEARHAGWTWAEIGEVLGISRQSAFARHRLAVRRPDGDSPRPFA